MNHTLFPYQIEGAEWLASRTAALLWDEQGLGKSAQVIRAADICGARDVLVICPAGVREHWRREWLQWQTIDRPVSTSPRGMFSGSVQGGVRIISYEAATSNLKALTSRSFDLMVCDEHHYLKNMKAARTKAVLGNAGLIRCAKRTWALSGTPMPNQADELWTILRTMAPRAIPGNQGGPMTYWEFARRYCNVEKNRFGTVVRGSRNLPELREAVKPYQLRRTKAKVMQQLPPMVWGDLPLEPSKAQAARLEAHPAFAPIAQAIAQAGDDADLVKEILRTIDKEHIASLVRLTGELKAELLVPALVEEMADSKHKVIVGFWHRSVGDALEAGLAHFGVVRVDGSTSSAARAKAIDSFQAEGPGPRIFLGQLVAAGTGISLTAAQDVVLCEMAWTPGVNSQFAARPHRHGQRGSVLVRPAFLSGSVDETISAALAGKAAAILAVVDGQFANDGAAA